MATFSNISLCSQATRPPRGDKAVVEGEIAVNEGSDVHIIASTGDKAVHVSFTSPHTHTFTWYDFGRSCQLWVASPDGELTRFDGFRLADADKVATALGITVGSGANQLQKRQLAAAGKNWGGLRVSGRTVEVVDASGQLVAPLPMAAISQAALPGRGEIEVQFYDVDTLEREDEACVEMRLYVPPDYDLPVPDARRAVEKVVARGKAKADAAGQPLTAEELDALQESAKDPATALHALISEGAGIEGVTGDAIAELTEEVGQFLVPRGRFAIELYPTVMRLVGRTYEFKVAYKSISRMFYLPKPTPGARQGEETRCFFVISLDDPIRHGSQRHPHLVMQIERSPIEVTLNISDEDVAARRYDDLGKDSKILGGDAPKVLAQLLKHISGKPVFRPGAFVSAGSAQAIHATCKGNDGYLYPLDKSFLFVHKPAMYIRYSDVDSVCFRRDDVGRTWDLEVAVKSVSGDAAHSVLFQGIDRTERDSLKTFLQSRGDLNIVETSKPSVKSMLNTLEALGDDEDDDDAGDGEDRKRSAGKRNRDDDDAGGEDEDEEEDEDFGSNDGGDDDDDDDDDDDEDEDDDDEFRKRKKKPAKKASTKESKKTSSRSKKGEKPKKRKRSRKDDDDEDDDDDDDE